MSNTVQHVLICYGNQLGYHHGAKYQILRNYHWYQSGEICVVTDKPLLFKGYPVRVLTLDKEQLDEWTLSGTNHFGIKLLGLKWAIETAGASLTRSLLLDTDMYWKANPNKLINHANPQTIILYENEGPVIGSKNKSIQRYTEALTDKHFNWEGETYRLTADSKMWRSSLIGLAHSRKDILSSAFKLFESLSPIVNAHTIEQFALGETSRIQGMQFETAKHLISNWSSTGRKNYVTPVLAKFFEQFGENHFHLHLQKHMEIRIHRPISVFIQQKFQRKKSAPT